LHRNGWNPLVFVNVSPPRQLDALVAYILDLADDQRVPYSTITNCLSALRFWSKALGHPTLLDPHQDTLKRLLKGLEPTPRERQERAKKTKRIPVTVDMLDSIYRRLWVSRKGAASHHDTDARMTCLSVHLAFALMLRCGEYVPKRNGDRAFQGKDIDFLHKDGSIVPLEEVLPSLSSKGSKGFTSIRLTLVSNKVDQSGKGHPFFVSKTDSPLAKRVYSMLWRWLVLVSPGPDDFLFSRPAVRGTGRKRLTTKMVKSCLIEAAALRGFPDSDLYRFSSHSLRAGGATYMDSLGFSRDEILKAGRWSAKGNHDLQYRLVTRVSTSALSKPRSTRRKGKGVTVSDVISALPIRR
jgi:hypothetical protein